MRNSETTRRLLTSHLGCNVRKSFRFYRLAAVGIYTQDSAEKLLPECLKDQLWLLKSPQSQIKTIKLQPSKASFSLIQDDLLHPILGGNKLRKLDGLLPELARQGFTDIVTCGGLQSAHTAAVACACAENGMRAHLLVRGERPAVPTGYHLLSRMFGHVTYVTRAEYSNRAAMFQNFVPRVQEILPNSKVYSLAEGASNPHALLGMIRLAHYLATSGTLDPNQPCQFVIDSGTGTTAIGMALGISLMQLPWKVTGVTLAGPMSYYQQQEADLKRAFAALFAIWQGMLLLRAGEAPSRQAVQWRDRVRPRKFGKVFPGEVAQCAEAAKRHGILLDPIYSLAAWEVASEAAELLQTKFSATDHEGYGCKVVMLHTGGACGLHGLAQRCPDSF